MANDLSPAQNKPKMPLRIEGSTTKILRVLYNCSQNISHDRQSVALDKLTALNSCVQEAATRIEQAKNAPLDANNAYIETNLKKAASSKDHAGKVASFVDPLEAAKSKVNQLMTDLNDYSKRHQALAQEAMELDRLLQKHGDNMPDSVAADLMQKARTLINTGKNLNEALKKLQERQLLVKHDQEILIDKTIRLVPESQRKLPGSKEEPTTGYTPEQH